MRETNETTTCAWIHKTDDAGDGYDTNPDDAAQ